MEEVHKMEAKLNGKFEENDLQAGEDHSTKEFGCLSDDTERLEKGIISRTKKRKKHCVDY